MSLYRAGLTIYLLIGISLFIAAVTNIRLIRRSEHREYLPPFLMHINWQILGFASTIIVFESIYGFHPEHWFLKLLYSITLAIQIFLLSNVYWLFAWNYFCASRQIPNKFVANGIG